MKRRNLQVMVFGSICLANWVVLTPVRAQFAATKQAALPSNQLQGISTLAPNGPPVAGRMQLSTQVTSYANDSYFMVRLDADNQAVVDASVELGDTNAGQTYLWVLRTKAEDSTTLWTGRYDNQLFEVTPVSVMTPTFHDVIKIPQGVTWVCFSLYRFPNTLDSSLFDNEEKVKQYEIISRSQKVEVQ